MNAELKEKCCGEHTVNHPVVYIIQIYRVIQNDILYYKTV